MSKKIEFILMGGTIDSHWDATQDTAIVNKESVIPRYIAGLKLYDNIKFTVVAMKDSRDLTQRDLSSMVKTVQRSTAKHIIITHGTYTMGDSARYLAANLGQHKKTIIFAGAMVPIDGFTFTDGPFNLGFAFGKFDELQNGIYISMNGRIFSPQEVTKVISQGRFTSIYQRPAMKQQKKKK